ncbi:hypothetical protein NQ176_g1535 [Zarea fungicola]|uniref:Uncharacterized protein n=1 Tax=Zarea fungicola TaxID=93591 RepID=A0ACC1NTN9_9HYPO|nr:hypothetical protein NQ176_g1535 [Lecanicillium fungicola]
MRYLAIRQELGALAGSAGFCTGLLPAAVATTGGESLVSRISRAQDFFQVALAIGIRSEEYRSNHLARELINVDNTAHSCSYVVDGLCGEAVAELLARANMGYDVFISAVLAPARVTLSGIPWRLSTFISEYLPSECRTAQVPVYSLYHNGYFLANVRNHVLKDLGRCGSLLQTEMVVSAPILSTVSGKPIVLPTVATLAEVAGAILDMILIEPVDWTTVQDSVIWHTNESVSERPVRIVNFGPGLGMSPTAHRNKLDGDVEVRNAVEWKPSNLISSHQRRAGDDIAIVGMAVDLPGASHANALWELLASGAQTTTEMPHTRFNASNFNGRDENEGKRSLHTKFGSFLENPFLFDADHFGISRREAMSMDPQQRVLLQTAYRALEDAGYVPDATSSFARSTFGCWIGTLRAFLSARISYVFGWSGPSITLDTACSSSIVALHQAARSILAGDCRAALVGAVNVITSPDDAGLKMYLGLDRAHFLSPSGQCKTFDASADGYGRAEGCGVFVIKRLSDAIAEHDRIHAIIKAIGVNQSGNAHSITHPHVPTQQALFEGLLRDAAISPHEISVVEMHGTGTQAGDPNEVESVRRALCKGRSGRNLLHITSSKPNIGHAEAASGMAGLAKLILMMKNGYIPPQVSIRTLNPRISQLGVDGAVIDVEGAKWPRATPETARMGMLNNFGAGGSNAAVIIAEHLNVREAVEDEPRPDCHSSIFVCGLSAKTERAITTLQDMLASHLASAQASLNPPVLADVCATLTSRRQLYDYRVAVIADSLQELAEKLRRAAPFPVSKSPCAAPQAVFVFTGQGSQYLGMGRELMECSVFADTVNMCDRWLVKNNYLGCVHIIQTKQEEIEHGKVDKTSWQALQCATFVLEVALLRLLVSWGIQPQAVAGHSLGEYAALVTAGVIDLLDGLKLVAHRALLIARLCELGPTSLLAVNCGATTAVAVIDASVELAGLTIACSNSAMDCVVGGPVRQLSLLKQHLTSTRGVRCKMLDVPVAFHTAAMDPILEDFTDFSLREVQVFPSRIPVISNGLHRTVAVGEPAFSPDYFAKQCRGTVDFDAGIRDYLAQTGGSDTPWRWIELGPHPCVLPMLRGRLSDAVAAPIMLPTLRKNVSPRKTMAELLRHFYQTSSGVRWRNVFAPNAYHAYKLIDLPGMPFFRSEFRVPYRDITADLMPRPVMVATSRVYAENCTSQAMQRSSHAATHGVVIHDTPTVEVKTLLKGHIVCGHALCPASVYHELVLTALGDVESGARSLVVWSLINICYTSPLVYDEKAEQTVRVIIEPTAAPPSHYNFTVISYTVGSDPELQSTVHCTGIVRPMSASAVVGQYSKLEALIRGSMQRLCQHDRSSLEEAAMAPSSLLLQVYSKRTMYEKLFTRVVAYSPLYQKAQSIRINEEKGEAVATCVFPQLDPGSGAGISSSNVVFMDVLLHVAGFCVNLKLPDDVAGICKEVGKAIILCDLATRDKTLTVFDVYCSSLDTQDGDGRSFTTANAYAVGVDGVLAVFEGIVFQHMTMARINQSLKMATFSSTRAASGERQYVRPTHIPEIEHAYYGVANSRGTQPHRPSSPSVNRQKISVSSLMAKVCGTGTGEPGSASRLDALGVDSLLTLELSAELSSALHAEVPPSAIANCTTVGDVEHLCEALTQATGSSSIDAVPHTPSTGSETPSSDLPSTTCASKIGDSIDVAKTVADVCLAAPGAVSLNSPLHTLGVDSLMLVELAHRLNGRLGDTALSLSALAECRTVEDIKRLVSVSYDYRVRTRKKKKENVLRSSTNHYALNQIEDKLQHKDILGDANEESGLGVVDASEKGAADLRQRTASKVILTLLPEEEALLPTISELLHLTHQPETIQASPSPQNSNYGSPLFLVHDGSGICTQYRRLRPLGRLVLALHDPSFLPVTDPQCLWASLTGMAAHYAHLISSATDCAAKEDCILGGWSFGGVVAFEAARILMAQGRNIKGVVLIDSPPPVDHIPLPDAVIDAVTANPDQYSRVRSYSEHGPTIAGVLRKLVQRSFRACADLLGDFRPRTKPREGVRKVVGPVPRLVLLRSATAWAPAQVRHAATMGDAEIPWLQDRDDRLLMTGGWEMLTGRPLPCVDIPGNHFQAFDAVNIEAVSAALGAACMDLDSGRTVH